MHSFYPFVDFSTQFPNFRQVWLIHLPSSRSLHFSVALQSSTWIFKGRPTLSGRLSCTLSLSRSLSISNFLLSLARSLAISRFLLPHRGFWCLLECNLCTWPGKFLPLDFVLLNVFCWVVGQTYWTAYWPIFCIWQFWRHLIFWGRSRIWQGIWRMFQLHFHRAYHPDPCTWIRMSMIGLLGEYFS